MLLPCRYAGPDSAFHEFLRKLTTGHHHEDMAVMTVLPFKKLDKIVDQAMLEWFTPLGFVRASSGGRRAMAGRPL